LPDIANFGWFDYGLRVGFWRLKRVLDRHGIRATVSLNASVCHSYPQIVDASLASGWEMLGHGFIQRALHVEADEREVIRRSLTTIKAYTGKAPRGWMGPGLAETFHTPDILAEEGNEYICDWCNDDQPYQMTLDDGRTIVSMPYTQQLNDKSAIERRLVSAEGFQKMICDQFDVLYKEGAKSGRVMAIALHPYLIGVPHRIGAFDAALKYICKHKKVWKATGSEIAQHYLAQCDGGRALPKSSARKRAEMRVAGGRR
jgi:peptidoglycan/xylan/chitin deacetylase (PgdA/CDA1 family)